jgi:hypothetical protein
VRWTTVSERIRSAVGMVYLFVAVIVAGLLAVRDPLAVPSKL